MDFTPSEAQRELGALTRQIVTDHVTVERLRAAEKAGARFDQVLWAALAQAGVLSADVGLLERCSVLVELGRALAPVPYLPTVAVAGAALAEFGSAPQRDRWLAPALAGQAVLAVAPCTDDAARPTAVGRSEPGWRLSAPTPGPPLAWRLTGEVTAVTAGPVADAFLVTADTAAGPSVFVVLPGDRGVTLERQRMVNHDDAAQLILDNVPLPDDRRMFAPDLVGRVGDLLTVGLCAYQLGVLERGLELTAEYARTRMQFGRPIGAFQAVSQRLADAYIDVQAVELALWHAAWTLENPETGEAPAAVATAKFWAADAGHRVAHTLVHVHGGTGIDLEHPVHRYFLAAKRTEFEHGSATASLLRLGDVLASHPL